MLRRLHLDGAIGRFACDCGGEGIGLNLVERQAKADDAHVLLVGVAGVDADASAKREDTRL